MGSLIILQGIPASGKTTWAREWVNEKPKERIRVNRDDIRKQLGPYWVPTREKLVTKIEEAMVVNAMYSCKEYKYRYDIVLDATNFKTQKWDTIAKMHGYDVEIKKFDIPLIVCLQRDNKRTGDNKVGAEVIIRMYDKHIKK